MADDKSNQRFCSGWNPNLHSCVIRHPKAQMAELVDALHSGCSGGNPVEVRVLFWALNKASWKAANLLVDNS